MTHIKMKKSRLAPAARKADILAAAVRRAEKVGLGQLRRDDVANEAGVANGLVTRYFNTMSQLKRAVIRYAVHNEILAIVAQALAMREPEAMKAPEELKRAALATLQ